MQVERGRCEAAGKAEVMQVYPLSPLKESSLSLKVPAYLDTTWALNAFYKLESCVFKKTLSTSPQVTKPPRPRL